MVVQTVVCDVIHGIYCVRHHYRELLKVILMVPQKDQPTQSGFPVRLCFVLTPFGERVFYIIKRRARMCKNEAVK